MFSFSVSAEQFCCCMSRVSRVFFLLLFLGISLLVPTAAVAANVIINPLGDFSNVTVMELSGNFDAYGLDINGNQVINTAPREAVAKEFYKTHGDDYDFLVFFTNFDHLMMTPTNRAFYTHIKNDTQGIGVDPVDRTASYGSSGRLQGTIDMANIDGWVADPMNPEFEKVLGTLTHELVHRWAANIQFVDSAGNPSLALLGKDDSHWSYLLDSEGSSLYGNNWQDNGDGTFTSVPPVSAQAGTSRGRIFNPLELYLMGLKDKSQVPPLTLIDNPLIDRTKLPKLGDTITGTALTVTIDQIIAAEGERIPVAADAQKSFRVGFIQLVVPGTMTQANVLRVENVRREWVTRFSILTDGAAIVSSELVLDNNGLPTNGGVTPPDFTPILNASHDAGVTWLTTNQQLDGSWQDSAASCIRDTAAALLSLKSISTAVTNYQNGAAWLGGVTPANTDFLARKVTSLDGGTSLNALLSRQNTDGGWGSASGYASSTIDTALALQALAAAGYTNGVEVTDAINYLLAAQLNTGGWALQGTAAMVQPTAFTLSAFNNFRADYSLDVAIGKGVAWLLPKQNVDGGFGNSPSTIHDTAATLLALRDTGASTVATDNAVSYLLANQSDDGSWQNSSFLTALAVEALWKGQEAPDLEILNSDITFTPATVTSTPADIAVTANVRNLGRTAVSQVKVSLYEGDPTLGVLLGEQLVDIAGNGATLVQFATNVAQDGIASFSIVVDENDLFVEGNEWNNSATAIMVVNLPSPVVGFEGASSAGSEAVGNVVLTVFLDHTWDEEISVPYLLNTASTASAADDFDMPGNLLVFAPGEVTKTIAISVADDLLAETDEEIIVDLGVPSVGSLGVAQYRYTIFDNELPVVNITSPRPQLSGDNTPLLLFTATGSTVVVRLDGVVVNKQSGDTLGPLSDGTHWVEIDSTNSLAMSKSARVDFSIDSNVPTVNIHSPRGVVSEATPLLDFTDSGVVSTVVRLDGVVIAKQSGDRLDPLAEGPHLLTVEVTNAQNLTSTASSSFVVDLVLPKVKIRFPYADAILSEIKPQLLFEQSEPGSVSVSVDGSALVLINSGDLLPVLADGEHIIRVELTNDWGTTVSDQVTFVVTMNTELPWILKRSFPLNLAGKLTVDKMGNIYVGSYGKVYKYSSAGVLLWSINPWVGLTFQSNVFDLAVDSKGNVYVAFTYNAGATPPGIVHLGYQDVLLAKISPEGVPGRPKRIATPSSDLVYEMAIDGEDNIYLAGLGGGALFPSVGIDSGFKTWVAKYASDFNDDIPGYDDNTDLTPIWAAQISQHSGTFPASVHLSVSPAGDVFVAGDTFGPLNTVGPGLGGGDFYIARWDNSGLFKGFVQGGTAGDETVAGLGTDALGNVYLSGSTTGVFDGTSITGPFVVRYDSNLSNRQLGALSETPVDMQVEADGDLYFENNQSITKLNRDFGSVWSEPKISFGAFQHGRFFLDDRGYLYAVTPVVTGNEIRIYQDPRLPNLTLDAVGDASALPMSVSGTVSAGASVGVSAGAGVVLSNFQKPSATTWTGDLTGLIAGKNNVEIFAKSAAEFKGYAYGTINYIDVNDAPSSTSASITTAEDMISIGVDPVVTDPDAGDTHTFSIETPPANGTAQVVGNQLVYTPNSNFYGTDSFTFRATDAGGLFVVGTATVRVTARNDAPTVVGSSQSTAEDTVLIGALSGSDIDGDSLSYLLVTDATNGIAVVNPDGSYRYTPNADYNGDDSFSYKVNDGRVDSNIAIVTLTVTTVNDAPVSSAGSLTTSQDVAGSGVLVATDIEGDALVFSIATQATDGVVVIDDAMTGAFTYTPNTGYAGNDSFSFRANDGTLDSNISSIAITVTDINDAPTATSASITTAEDMASVGVTPTVFDADSGDSHTFAIEAQPTNGTAEVVGNQLVYTPNADFNGSDGFTFRATDSGGLSVVGTARITVTAVNDAPVIIDASVSTTEDTAFNGNLPVATDIDGDSLNYLLVADAANGSTVVNPDGSYSYTPNADFFGSDSFSYKVNDGTIDSSVAQINMTVIAVNDAPVSSAGSLATSQNAAGRGVLVATDIEADPLTFAIVSQATEGIVVIRNTTTGAYTYTPNSGYVGSDSFSFKVNDGTVDSNISSIAVIVTDINDAPSATSARITTAEDITSVGVTPSVSDPDIGDTHTFIIATQPANGTAQVVGNQLVYTPNLNFNGNDSFAFRATDAGGLFVVGTANVSVIAVNDAPVAVDMQVSSAEDMVIDGALIALDHDGDALTYAVVIPATNGTVVITNVTTGAYSYTPNAEFSGNDSFAFSVNDGNIESASATVSLMISPVNDAPVISSQIVLSTAEDTALSITLADLVVSDPDSIYPADFVLAVQDGANYTRNGNQITPDSDFNGTLTVPVVVNDGVVDSVSYALSIDVAAVNDVPVINSQVVLSTVEEVALTLSLSPT